MGDFEVVIGPPERCTELGLTDKELNRIYMELIHTGVLHDLLKEFAAHHSAEVMEKVHNWINYCFYLGTCSAQ